MAEIPAADRPGRYRFQPLERRGLILGLGGAQLATILCGVLGAGVAMSTAAGPLRVPSALLLLAVSGSASLWQIQARPLVSWFAEVLRWTARRSRGPRLDVAPVEGRAVNAEFRGLLCREASTAPPGIELCELEALPGEPALGVVFDRRSGSAAGVVPVNGGSFTLLDAAQQAERLDAWRAVLAGLSRPGSTLYRLQWVERSDFARATGLTESARRVKPDCEPRARALASYQELLAGSAGSVQTRDVWVVLAVRFDRGIRGGCERAGVTLRRELRLLEGQLRNAGLAPLRPLGLADLRRVMGATNGSGGPWPIAVREEWSSCRTDGKWHATFWVAEWPRVDVGSDFLSPLLLSGGRRSVAVIMAPVATERALREVRSARAADIADAEIRRRAGFVPSARRIREAEGADGREVELADGHAEFRFSAFVTVSALDEPGLAEACAEIVHAAESAHLELRRLYGRQAEAMAWTLPLARGLA
jgi:hypothetical protein